MAFCMVLRSVLLLLLCRTLYLGFRSVEKISAISRCSIQLIVNNFTSLGLSISSKSLLVFSTVLAL